MSYALRKTHPTYWKPKLVLSRRFQNHGRNVSEFITKNFELKLTVCFLDCDYQTRQSVNYSSNDLTRKTCKSHLDKIAKVNLTVLVHCSHEGKEVISKCVSRPLQVLKKGLDVNQA